MSYNPLKGHKISSANSTSALLGAGATFTGAWENVVNYTSVATTILGSVATSGTLYFDLSTDGGSTFTSVPSTIEDATFAVPRILNVVETHVRIRYVNGATPQTGTFSLQTKYSNGQQLGLLSSVDGVITDEYPVSIVRAVSVSKDPNGQYGNIPGSGVSNALSTTTPLGISGVWTSAWVAVTEYAEIRISYDADVAGDDCRLEFSPDGVTVERSIPVPPQANSLQTNFGGVHTLNPILPYFRIVYTNGAAAQTSFDVTTILSTQSGNGLVSRSTQVLNKYNDVRLSRLINSPEQDRNFGLIGYERAQRKFGVNEAVGNGAYEDIWAEGGLYPLLETATTVRVQAGGNAADTAAGAGARTITVEGLDENWNEVSEDISLAGASASASTTATFIRINRVFVKTCGAYGSSNTGIIRIEDTAATVGVLAHLPAGLGITFQSIYAVPANHIAYVTEIKISVGAGDSADVRMWNIEDGSTTFPVKKYESTIEDFSGYQPDKLETYLKFTGKETIGFDAIRITGSGTARISIEFDFILVED
jgi:hypothetical protein